jgi:hypothetical protein
MLSRRNIMTILGISSVGIAAEDAYGKDIAPYPHSGMYDHKQFATALRRLADEVEAKSVEVERLHVGTELIARSAVRQLLTLSLILKEEAA